MARIGLTLAGSATLADNHDALVVHGAAADAVGRLPTPRQRQMAMDFAANRRFRRDVFVRAPGTGDDPGPGARAAEMVIGVTGNPDRLAARVTVPRGTMRFDEAFVEDVRALMARGSTTFHDAVVTLAAARHDPMEITRNLLFMVAGGALTPFASVAPPRDGTALHRRPANRAVAATLAFAVEHRSPRAIPSEVLGNGVPVDPIEALAVDAWLHGADGVDEMAARVASGIARLELYETADGVPLAARRDAGATARRVAETVTGDLLPGLIRLGLVE
jgi:hypothetical protein